MRRGGAPACYYALDGGWGGGARGGLYRVLGSARRMSSLRSLRGLLLGDCGGLVGVAGVCGSNLGQAGGNGGNPGVSGGFVAGNRGNPRRWRGGVYI
jgi:hypothetical protein